MLNPHSVTPRPVPPRPHADPRLAAVHSISSRWGPAWPSNLGTLWSPTHLDVPHGESIKLLLSVRALAERCPSFEVALRVLVAIKVLRGSKGHFRESEWNMAAMAARLSELTPTIQVPAIIGMLKPGLTQTQRSSLIYQAAQAMNDIQTSILRPAPPLHEPHHISPPSHLPFTQAGPSSLPTSNNHLPRPPNHLSFAEAGPSSRGPPTNPPPRSSSTDAPPALTAATREERVSKIYETVTARWGPDWQTRLGSLWPPQNTFLPSQSTSPTSSNAQPAPTPPAPAPGFKWDAVNCVQAMATAEIPFDLAHMILVCVRAVKGHMTAQAGVTEGMTISEDGLTKFAPPEGPLNNGGWIKAQRILPQIEPTSTITSILTTLHPPLSANVFSLLDLTHKAASQLGGIDLPSGWPSVYLTSAVVNPMLEIINGSVSRTALQDRASAEDGGGGNAVAGPSTGPGTAGMSERNLETPSVEDGWAVRLEWKRRGRKRAASESRTGQATPERVGPRDGAEDSGEDPSRQAKRTRVEDPDRDVSGSLGPVTDSAGGHFPQQHHTGDATTLPRADRALAAARKVNQEMLDALEERGVSSSGLAVFKTLLAVAEEGGRQDPTLTAFSRW